MTYLSFFRRDRRNEAVAQPVIDQENTLSETLGTEEFRNRLVTPKLLAAGPAHPVTGLSDLSKLGHSLDGQLLISRLKDTENPDVEEITTRNQQHHEEDGIRWSFPLEGSPICYVCSHNHMGGMSVLNRQVFWTLRHLRVNSPVCPSCLMITNAMGDLLDTGIEDSLVCGRVEHFATDCRSLDEARRMWLFAISFSQTRDVSKASLVPKSYLEPEQPTSKSTIGCIQQFDSGSPGSKRYNLFSGRYVNPKGADFNLISGWISTCESSHGEKCGRDDHPSTGAPSLRVVDVRKGCVVVAPVNCRYFALSYVWGASQQLQLNSRTLDYLSTEGSLLENNVKPVKPKSHFSEATQIPGTIRDAIKLCQRLGERYLWVDSLCILQDNANDKHDQISHMDAVYREAVLTIVAAAGTDCNYGLPGVRERQPISFLAHTGDVPVITTDRDVIQTMLSSKWNKRAWTLQEKILSQRLLVFTPQLVFFYCHTALWREDVELEDPRAEIYLNERELLDSQILDRSAASHGPVKAFTESYTPLVTAFVCRELSREEDALSAFSGVCRSLEPALGCFRWGLPSRLFGISLLWRVSLPDYESTDLDSHKYASSYVRSTPMLSRSPRRASIEYYEGGRLFLQSEDAMVVEQRQPASISFDPDTDLITSNTRQTWDMRTAFPSWSWAGWKHWDDSQILFDQPLDIRSLLSFFEVTFSPPTKLINISSIAPTYMKSQPIVNLTIFLRCGLDLYRIREELQDHLKPPNNPLPSTLSTPQQYYHRIISNNNGGLHTTPTNPDSLIAFWSSTSEAKIRLRSDSTLTISTSSGLRMAELKTNRLLQLRLGGVLEFVVVAYTLEGELMLLLVQWGEQGIAYRAPVLGLVFRIDQDDWLATKPYKKLIVLG